MPMLDGVSINIVACPAFLQIKLTKENNLYGWDSDQLFTNRRDLVDCDQRIIYKLFNVKLMKINALFGVSNYILLRPSKTRNVKQAEYEKLNTCVRFVTFVIILIIRTLYLPTVFAKKYPDCGVWYNFNF